MVSEDWPKTCSSQDFSKSAPNLDKSRQHHKQLFCSRNALCQNSDEGIINNKAHSSTNPASPNSQIKIEYDPKSSRIILITDNNNRNVKFHKKHSLDSSDYDQTPSQNSQTSERTIKNNNSILYDRIFYRKVQQKIFSSTDYLDNTDNLIQKQKKQSSKSSGDLTNDNDYYDNFNRKGSQFSRECFFTVNHNHKDDEDEFIYRGDCGDVTIDKMNSANSSFDEQSNSICSDASSVSRKSSTVTFRQDHDVINSLPMSKKGDIKFDINRSIEKLYKCQTNSNVEISSDGKKQKANRTLSNFRKMFGKKKLSTKSATTLSTNSLVYKEFRNENDSSENLETSKRKINFKKI